MVSSKSNGKSFGTPKIMSKNLCFKGGWGGGRGQCQFGNSLPSDFFLDIYIIKSNLLRKGT